MSGTSATGGFVTDRTSSPGAREVEGVLQQMIVATTELAPPLVRPRYQPMPPARPPADVSWAAVGIIMVEADDYPYEQHVGIEVLPGETKPGYTIMQRHNTLTALVTFYGPEAETLSGRLRDALYIGQNMEPFAVVNAKMRSVEDLARNPEVINQQYINRVDMRITLRQQVTRVYPIFDIAAAHVVLQSDTGLVADAPVDPTFVPRSHTPP